MRLMMNKKLKVYNVRIGLACNSSSSHSILLLNDGVKVTTTENEDFGWDFFTAADKQSKDNYLAACVLSTLSDIIPEAEQERFMRKFFNDETLKAEKYVDHQSLLLIPTEKDGSINEAFLKDFQAFLHRDDVVIGGGNDNTDQNHELLENQQAEVFYADMPTETANGHWRARKDEAGGYWTLFNKISGSKLRFSFDDKVAPVKAFAPELVDIKITDYCPFDCEFCYQDSTLQGKHSSWETLENLAEKLSKVGVMEVALGGGETTMHPRFVDILKLFQSKDIVANFTTKNLNLFRSKNAKEIVDNAGAIAFSIENAQDVKKVSAAMMDYPESNKFQRHYGDRQLVTMQFVMGTTDLNEFKQIVRAAAMNDLNLTLLGYKENGRGQGFGAQNYDGWLDILKQTMTELSKEGYYTQISIDTALAAQYRHELEASDVSLETFHTTEGAFSLYVDAVKNQMAPSSYTGLEQACEFSDNWLENYQTMSVEAPNKKPKKMWKIG